MLRKGSFDYFRIGATRATENTGMCKGRVPNFLENIRRNIQWVVIRQDCYKKYKARGEGDERGIAEQRSDRGAQSRSARANKGGGPISQGPQPPRKPITL